MVRAGANPEISPCSDLSLKLETMKLESRVIVDQNATVKLYSSLGHLACQVLEVLFGLKIYRLSNRNSLRIVTKDAKSISFLESKRFQIEFHNWD